MSDLLKLIGGFVMFLASMILFPIVYGFVLVKLWVWIVNPIFGVELITLGQAVCINFIISFFKLSMLVDKPKKDDRELAEIVAQLVGYLTVAPGLFLLLGYIYSEFI